MVLGPLQPVASGLPSVASLSPPREPSPCLRTRLLTASESRPKCSELFDPMTSTALLRLLTPKCSRMLLEFAALWASGLGLLGKEAALWLQAFPQGFPTVRVSLRALVRQLRRLRLSSVGCPPFSRRTCAAAGSASQGHAGTGPPSGSAARTAATDGGAASGWPARMAASDSPRLRSGLHV